MNRCKAASAESDRFTLLAKLFHRLSDVVLPPQCFGCGARVESNGALCASCWGRIQFIEKPYCPRLGIPFPFAVGEGVLSAEAIARPPPFARARAVARFDDMARKLVHALKYGDRMECAPLMGGWMARAGHELIKDADLIAPVPLFRRRLWMRRYNQSALLANQIGKKAAAPVVLDLLQRIRPTRSQTGLSHQDRQRNVAGAFKVLPIHAGQIKNRRILLVDDVLTTGATAAACARTLIKAGAEEVDVLVFARVVDSARLPI